MFENIAAALSSEPAAPVEFEVSLQINGQSVSKLDTSVDDSGITFKTKKDTVFFPRSEWLDVSMADKTIALVVHGIQYTDWGKKRKFEKKNPGEIFSDFTPADTIYILAVNQKRLVTVTLEDIKQALERTFLLAYLDESTDPAASHIIRCPGCSRMMDITPCAETENIFCPDCSSLLKEISSQDKSPAGICGSCGYYTKLVEYKTAVETIAATKVEKRKTCHPCRVKNTIKSFFITLLAVIGIAVINLLALMADRYFPVLILIGTVMLLVNIFTLIKVILYSAARKAVGASDIENAVTAVRRGDTDKAFEILSTMSGNMAENPGIMLNLIKGLIHKGELEKAGQMCESLISKFPNFHFAYAEKLNILLKSGASPQDIEKAQNDLTGVIVRNNLQSPKRLGLAASAK